MVKKNFFGEFAKHEKKLGKSVQLFKSDWDLLEAYRLYGSNQSDNDISLNELLQKIVTDHINSDREFNKVSSEWLEKTKLIKKSLKTKD